jgi:hypothetical protein
MTTTPPNLTTPEGVEAIRKACDAARPEIGAAYENFQFASFARTTLPAALDEIVRLRGALEPLVAACEQEFMGPPVDEYPDDAPVMAGVDSESPITFGMIRRARQALAANPATGAGEVDRYREALEQIADTDMPEQSAGHVAIRDAASSMRTTALLALYPYVAAAKQTPEAGVGGGA